MVCSDCQSVRSSDAINTVHCNPLHVGLDKFRLNGKYCDVNIRVEGKIFRCHRAVLASVCEFFDSMLGGNFKESSQSNDITLVDIDAKSFEIILKFIYSGREPHVNQENVYGLLRSSDFLQLQTVKNLCVEYILSDSSSFSAVNTFEVFHLACGMNDRLVMDTLIKHIVLHLRDFLRNDFFVEMAYDCLNLVLDAFRSSPVHFSCENFLLDAVIRWVLYNYEERRKFLLKLIETINFDKITADCVEFWLEQRKIDSNALNNSRTYSEVLKNRIVPLKTLILDAFSLDYEFVSDDDALPISYEDPPPKISQSIHVYVTLESKNRQKGENKVFSLNDPDYHDKAEDQIVSSESSPNEHAWLISSTFLLDYNDYILATLNNPDRIYRYSYLGGEFRAYTSIDISSDQYTELSTPKEIFFQSYTNRSATDGNIYLHCKLRGQIPYYSCSVDKWLQIPQSETKVTHSGFVAENNLLYLIEGDDCNKKQLNNFIQVYDCRSPRWLCLSKFSDGTNCSFDPKSCITIDGKIYVYNGKRFRVFDVAERKWRNMNLEGNNFGYNSMNKWKNGTRNRFSEFTMIHHKNHLLLFNCSWSKYLSCNYRTETFDEFTLFDNNYCQEEYFAIKNVIAL